MRQTRNTVSGGSSSTEEPGSAGSSGPERSSGRAGLDGTVDLARDRDLVERCQGGDQSAFGELYDRYHRRLFRFCLRRLYDPNDAEEAVQETFTRAWRALPRFGGERRFYPWLSVIAGNVCTDVLRRRSRLVPMEDLPLPAGVSFDDDVDAALLRQVDLAMATEALGHLSERHQRVLRLREAAGWSTQRIAEQEGVAVPAVDTLLWRAHQAFKREFVALAEAGGKLAAAAGAGVLAVRRFGLRHAARLAARLPFPSSLAGARSPGVLLASMAVTAAAIAGGTLAAVDGGSHQAPPGLPAATTAAGAPVATAGVQSGTAPVPGSRGIPASAPAGRGSAHAAGAAPTTSPAGDVPASSGAGTLGSAVAGTSTSSSAGGAVDSTAGTAVGGAVGGVVGGVFGAAGGLVNGVVGTINGLTTTLGLSLSGSSSTTTTSPGLLGSAGTVVNGVSGAVGSTTTSIGQVLHGLTGTSSRPSGAAGTGSGGTGSGASALDGLLSG